jgi:cobalt/nickel transport system ATP-binding protein
MGDEAVELIRLSDITFAYPGRPPVLQGLDFTLNQGDRLGILGPNGAGKSTMFQVAMGFLQPQGGRVFGLGLPCRRERDFRPLRRAVGYLFQDPDDQLFCPTVAEDVAFGPRNLGLSLDQALVRVDQTLDALGLGDYGHRLTYQLSGGEKRLVSLAAVLAMRPQGLLLDEPMNGLDHKHQEQLERVLLDSSLSWAMVSHDRSLLERTCAIILCIEDGRLRLEEKRRRRAV